MPIKRPWWDAAVAAGLFVNALLLWITNPSTVAATGQPAWAPWVVLAVVAASYAGFGRFAVTASRPQPALWAFIALLVVATGVGVYLQPSLATLQTIAYPLIWCIVDRTRDAVVASCATAVAVFAGLVFAPIDLGQAGNLAASAGIAALSLAFALTFGLWITRVFEYAHEREVLVEQLTAAQDELAAMHREAGEASERARLARELHDTVTQSLTGLVMLAERTGAGLRAAGQTDAAAALALMEETARDALAEARALVATMTPASTDSSLADALQRLATRFERETGVVVETIVRDPHLPRDREVVLLRCAQEGLANVRKHARASHVAIEVVATETSEVSLRVIDDGVGPAAVSAFTDGGFGITGMRERVGMLGGQLSLAARPGGGAELAVTIPAAS